MKIVAFLSFSVFIRASLSEETMKKPWNPRAFTLINVWWVDIHKTLTICLFRKERQRKVNLLYEDELTFAQRFAFSLIYSNTQFRTKHTAVLI